MVKTFQHIKVKIYMLICIMVMTKHIEGYIALFSLHKAGLQNAKLGTRKYKLL